MTSFAVIGAYGQLGRDLCASLGERAVALGHQDVELTDPDSIRRSLAAIEPQTVINAAAYNHVDSAESDPLQAFAVNCHGPARLARVCSELGSRLVHFSSDYVFGHTAERAQPYREDDFPGPMSNYGLSKLAGEFAVRANCSKCFIIRTCGLYGVNGIGGKGGNFVETMVKLGSTRDELSVVNDQVCTPTYTRHLAQASLQLASTDAFGLYHWTNSGQTSWFEFAREIFRLRGIGCRVKPISSAEFGAAATRPGFSVLATKKFSDLGFGRPPEWKSALAEYFEERDRRRGPKNDAD